MKSYKILFSILMFSSAQNILPNYFLKQVIPSAVVGAVASGIHSKMEVRREEDCIAIPVTLGAYVILKCFYDVLTSNTPGEFGKAFISFPLNLGVSAASYFATSVISGRR